MTSFLVALAIVVLYKLLTKRMPPEKPEKPREHINFSDTPGTVDPVDEPQYMNDPNMKDLFRF